MVNPIRRVTTLLQRMQTKIANEGKKELEIYDKYFCWCSTGAGRLAKAINDAEPKLPQLRNSIEGAETKKSQLEGDIQQHKALREEAKEAIDQASNIRLKGASEFAKEVPKAERKVAAITQAIKAFGMRSNSFLQSSASNVLRKLAVEIEMTRHDRDLLSTFLLQQQDLGYISQSGEIAGILKMMRETIEKGLAGAKTTEKEATEHYEALVAAKNREIKASSKAIEQKLPRQAGHAVDIATMKEDLDHTLESLAQDRQFLADLNSKCKQKKKEWIMIQKTRNKELLVIADTINILNGDDALELFKKTFGRPLFIQMSLNGKELKRKAMNLLLVARRSHGISDVHLDLISMALRAHKSTFEEVTSMIDAKVALLEKEQADDNRKKMYCNAELDKTGKAVKELHHNITGSANAINNSKGTIAALVEETVALRKGVKNLDLQVIEETGARKSGHARFVDMMVADKAALKLLSTAKNRLYQFYHPKVHKETPRRGLTDEKRRIAGMGGRLTPTAALGGIAGTGINVFQQASKRRPPNPRAVVPAYRKQHQESNGVIAMIDILVGDIHKGMQQQRVEERDSQADYEQFVADAAAQRVADVKSAAAKDGSKADLEASLLKLEDEEKDTKSTKTMAATSYQKGLHIECDWLLSNFDARKEGRDVETDALKQAKAVLSGADDS